MRKWRVGTVSMGLSLILLGVFLSISQIKGFEAFEPMLMWWPLILVVLGIEILLFLSLSKQENPVIKYDILSIIFVGFLGTVGIVLTLLTSTGLLHQVQTVIGAVEETYNLPEVEEVLTGEIKRVIIETGNQNVKIEGTAEQELHVFGTYRATVGSNENLPIVKAEDYSMTKMVGNTLYVYLKTPSRKTGPVSTYTSMHPTIVVPENIRLEVRGEHNQIDLHAGALNNHWVINGMSSISVHLKKDSDLLLSASSRNEIQTSNLELDSVEQNEDEEGYNQQYKGTLTLGNGTYHLDIMNSDYVSINLVEDM